MKIKNLAKAIYAKFFNIKLFFANRRIGRRVFIGRRTYVNKRKHLFIGNDVRIGNDFEVRFYTDFAGVKYDNPVPQVTISEGCYIGNKIKILCNDTVLIHKNVLMASDILITTENHGTDVLCGESYGRQPLTHKPVEIEEHCWIGEKVIILPGVKIGKWSIVAGGAVVTKSVPEYTVVAGNPARVIKQYDFDAKRWVRKE